MVWHPCAAQEVWSGPACELPHYLAADRLIMHKGSRVLVPRQIILLWERRRDLQRRFPLATPAGLDAYLGWALTEGASASGLSPELLSPAFISAFTKVEAEPLKLGADTIPFLRGLRITRTIEGEGTLLAAKRRFPRTQTSRLAHGFWFAFVAPKRYRWSAAMVAPVRACFERVSAVEVDGLMLTRAALAPWQLDRTLRQRFPLATAASRWDYLCWLVLDALPELGLSVDDLDPRLRPFLAQPSSRAAGLARALEMVHHHPALRRQRGLADPARRQGLEAWARANLFTAFPQLALPRPPRTVYRRLCLSGYWTSASGRGEDVRGYAAALRAVGFTDFAIVDIWTGALLDHQGVPLEVQGRPAEALDSEVNICVLNADTAFADWVRLRHLKVRAGRVIGSWAWELDRLPSYWRHAFSFYDEIWSASRFADRAFRATALRPVRLVPMAVLPEEPAHFSRARLGVPLRNTMFLFLFDFRSHSARKNPEAVVAAFRRAFPKGTERASLVLKTQGAAVDPRAWARLRHCCAEDKRIVLIDTTLTRGETLGLIALADAFVSLHRSEGFGRGVAEAMLLGVPIIATDYSGTRDFLNEETALLVDYRLVPVPPEDYPGVQGQCWAEPNIITAARHMQWVCGHRAQAGELGQRGRRRIRGAYSPPAVGAAMLSALQAKQGSNAICSYKRQKILFDTVSPMRELSQ